MTENKLQGGQTLLIVVLVMVIAATVGLSVVSRSITNLRTSTEEASSAKALSAAEAGIQRALQTNSNIANSNIGNGAGYTTNVATASGAQVLLNGGNTITQDEGIDLWLVPHDGSNNPVWGNTWSGNLTLYWGDSSGDCNNAALEIVIITQSSGYVLTRYAVDPCSSRGNNFTIVASTRGTTIGGKTFIYSYLITISSGLLGRVVPLYTSTSVGMAGATSGGAPLALPSQGQTITSTGTLGDVKRVVNVFKGYAQLPAAYFTYGFFFPK